MSAVRSGPSRKVTRGASTRPLTALELLDLTLADPRWKCPRLREIARTREVVCDFLVGDNVYRSTPELLDAYFLAFAIAARRDR